MKNSKHRGIVLDDPAKKFLDQLQTLRKQTGLTQRDFAEYAGITYSMYRVYEEGYYRMSPWKLFRLAEIFNYDLSDSVNYKIYYGLFDTGKKNNCAKDRKVICLDPPAKIFLDSARALRLKKGLTLKEIGQLTGCNYTSLGDFELRKNNPLLGTFIRLSELYEWDVSESVNYKYFYRKIDSVSLKNRLKRVGLSIVELAGLVGYQRANVSMTVNFGPALSLNCLWRILEVLAREEQSLAVREKIIRGPVKYERKRKEKKS